MNKRFIGHIAAVGALLALFVPSANAGFDFLSYAAKPLIASAQLGPSEGEITFNGMFCPEPWVFQGRADGSFARLQIMDYTPSVVEAKLAETTPGITYKFGIKCFWHLATIDVTIPDTNGVEDTAPAAE